MLTFMNSTLLFIFEWLMYLPVLVLNELMLDGLEKGLLLSLDG